MSSEQLRASDPVVVMRYLRLRNYFQDSLLARVDAHLAERYEVQPTRRVPSALMVLVRNGYQRPGEGEVWPLVFLGPMDVTLGLLIDLSNDRLAALGTVLNGPRPMRHHRHWEDLWGWETPLGEVHPQLFTLDPDGQASALFGWYTSGLEWLVRNGLMKRK